MMKVGLYFDWMYNMMCEGKIPPTMSYYKLFKLLDNIDFVFYLPEDSNRAIDGQDLRYRFMSIVNIDGIDRNLNDPCSFLEMLIALSIRCEDTIMGDSRYGDRTRQWFWTMLNTIGIGHMTDDIFDEKEATCKIYKALERQYEPSGKGGLFYVPKCGLDMRNIDIWGQMCAFLNQFE